MIRLIHVFITLLALTTSPVFAQPAPESSSVTGTVRVEKSLIGNPDVEVVAPTGETTRLVGEALETLAALAGRTVKVEGPVTQSSDGTRTMIVEVYAVQ